MFKLRTLILLFLALSSGLGAAVFANNWMSDQLGKTVEATDNSIPILVAGREISFGKPLEAIDIKYVDWPKTSLPEGHFIAEEDVIGKLANRKILVGEPLLPDRVVENLSGSALSAMIAPSKRAITVRVNDVAGVAGFLLPGNRVDVLGSKTLNRKTTTKTILQNLKVLAIDQKSNPDKDEPVVVRAVTLEADLDESIKLVNATQEGSVQLVLRNPEDKIKLAQNSEKPAPKISTPRRATPTVTIIRGTSVNKSRLR